jgi:hypothetical protein
VRFAQSSLVNTATHRAPFRQECGGWV